MEFRLFPSTENKDWLGHAFRSSNRSKTDILQHLEFLVAHIHSGKSTVGEDGIIDKKEQDDRVIYAVEVFGANFLIEIVDAEPPKIDLKFVLVAAQNPLSK